MSIFSEAVVALGLLLSIQDLALADKISDWTLYFRSMPEQVMSEAAYQKLGELVWTVVEREKDTLEVHFVYTCQDSSYRVCRAQHPELSETQFWLAVSKDLLAGEPTEGPSPTKQAPDEGGPDDCPDETPVSHKQTPGEYT